MNETAQPLPEKTEFEKERDETETVMNRATEHMRQRLGLPEGASKDEIWGEAERVGNIKDRRRYGLADDATSEELERAKQEFMDGYIKRKLGLPPEATKEDVARADREYFGVGPEATDEELRVAINARYEGIVNRRTSALGEKAKTLFGKVS